MQPPSTYLLLFHVNDVNSISSTVAEENQFVPYGYHASDGTISSVNKI